MIKRCWRRFLAIFRLSQSAICEESAGLGMFDYHDYPDSERGEPDHFVTLKCRYCGKRFII